MSSAVYRDTVASHCRKSHISTYPTCI